MDAAVKEVNEMLGELDTSGTGERDEPPGESLLPHHILIVDRRYCNACLLIVVLLCVDF